MVQELAGGISSAAGQLGGEVCPASERAGSRCIQGFLQGTAGSVRVDPPGKKARFSSDNEGSQNETTMKAMESDPPGQQRLSVPRCSRPCRQECGKHAPAEICAGAPTHLAEGRHCKGGVSARGQIPPCV